MNGTVATRRILLGVTMIVTPALLVVGHLLTVSADKPAAALIDGITAAGGMYVPSTIMIAYGVLLMPVAFVGLMRFAPGRGGVLVTIGAALSTVAAVGLGAGNAMFGMVLGSLLPGHPDLAASVIEVAGDSPAESWGWQLFPLFPTGFVLMAIGLVLARGLPVWVPILLGVGGLLVIVSGAGGLVTFLLLMPLSAGFAAAGVLLIARRGERRPSEVAAEAIAAS